jgi:ABC-type cobalamin/Fe3+-siderophores transport system ATPase subunit
MKALSQAERIDRQPCERCGGLGVDAVPEGSSLVLTCPRCGHEERRRLLPFFSITGPSGSGKSTLVRRLWRLLPECVVFDGDVLWHEYFWENRQAFYDGWLALAGQASQSASAVVVCTAAMPDDWGSTFAAFVGKIHMLALVCDEDELMARLARRVRSLDDRAPADFLEQTRIFNRVLRQRLEHVDTAVLDEDEVAERVAAWIRVRL